MNREIISQNPPIIEGWKIYIRAAGGINSLPPELSGFAKTTGLMKMVINVLKTMIN